MRIGMDNDIGNNMGNIPSMSSFPDEIFYEETNLPNCDTANNDLINSKCCTIMEV